MYQVQRGHTGRTCNDPTMQNIMPLLRQNILQYHLKVSNKNMYLAISIIVFARIVPIGTIIIIKLHNTIASQRYTTHYSIIFTAVSVTFVTHLMVVVQTFFAPNSFVTGLRRLFHAGEILEQLDRTPAIRQ